MKYIYLAIALILFTSCEDVIDLPLEEGPKRLVIDANINWEKDKTGITTGNEQQIRLTQTAGYYDTYIPPANGATVTISDSTKEYVFIEDGDSGIYKTTDFEPQLNETYTLHIEYNGEEFSATETLIPVADIEKVEQSVENIFGTEIIKVEFFYQDPVGEGDFYLSQFKCEESYTIDYYGTRGDELTDGQLNSVFEMDEKLEVGNTLVLKFYGASKDYTNYFNLLQQQLANNGPFATPPASVKGNCTNETNPDNKPLGYFRLSQMFVEEYIIQ